MLKKTAIPEATSMVGKTPKMRCIVYSEYKDSTLRATKEHFSLSRLSRVQLAGFTIELFPRSQGQNIRLEKLEAGITLSLTPFGHLLLA